MQRAYIFRDIQNPSFARPIQADVILNPQNIYCLWILCFIGILFGTPFAPEEKQTKCAGVV
jgi:hypothetical protein